MSLPDLHDWTLAELGVVLQSNQITVLLVGPSQELELHGSGLESMRLDRSMPWGPSASINSAQLTREGGVDVLLVELQSGDQMQVRASKIISRAKSLLKQ